MVKSIGETFKNLKELGYDCSRIREVMRTHRDFDSALAALAALEHETSARMQEELLNHGISPITAEILTKRFKSTQEALSCYNGYMSLSESIKSDLNRMGFTSPVINSCINRLLPLEEAIIEALHQQDSVSSPTPAAFVNMHPTDSIRQGSIINNPPTHPVDIPGNIPTNIAEIPGVYSQFSPSPINIPLTPVQNSDEELSMRSNTRIEHVSASSIRPSNDSSQSNRRTQSSPAYEEGSLVQTGELDVMERSDHEAILTFENLSSEMFDTFTVSRQSIGANPEEAYRNIMAVPEPDGPLESPVHPLRHLRALARDGHTVAGEILMKILRNIYQSKGISEETLQRLNTVDFQETMNINCEDCAICFKNFANDEKLIILLCGHPFHSGCVSRWLRDSKLCPCCKVNLDDEYFTNILY